MLAAAAGGKAAGAFGVVVLGVLDGSEGVFELLIHLGAVPFFGLEVAKDFEVTGESVAGDGDFLDEFLGVIEFAVEAAGAAGEFFEDVALAGGEALLFLAEFLEMFFLALDFLLLLAEEGEALLGGLNLVLDIVDGIVMAVEELGSGFEAEDVVFFVAEESGGFAGHDHIGNYFLYGYITEPLNIPVFSFVFLRGRKAGHRRGG